MAVQPLNTFFHPPNSHNQMRRIFLRVIPPITTGESMNDTQELMTDLFSDFVSRYMGDNQFTGDLEIGLRDRINANKSSNPNLNKRNQSILRTN
jgi:hypothetical protein